MSGTTIDNVGILEDICTTLDDKRLSEISPDYHPKKEELEEYLTKIITLGLRRAIGLTKGDALESHLASTTTILLFLFLRIQPLINSNPSLENTFKEQWTELVNDCAPSHPSHQLIVGHATAIWNSAQLFKNLTMICITLDDKKLATIPKDYQPTLQELDNHFTKIITLGLVNAVQLKGPELQKKLDSATNILAFLLYGFLQPIYSNDQIAEADRKESADSCRILWQTIANRSSVPEYAETVWDNVKALMKRNLPGPSLSAPPSPRSLNTVSESSPGVAHGSPVGFSAGDFTRGSTATISQVNINSQAQVAETMTKTNVPDSKHCCCVIS